MGKNIYQNINLITQCRNALKAFVLQNNHPIIWSQKREKFVDRYADLYLFVLNSARYDVRQY